MTRKEKYNYLRSLGLSSELARKWRDRKIEKIETKDKNTILRNNSDLRRDFNNYIKRLRYNFLRELGLSSDRAKRLRSNNKIDVSKLKLHKNKIVKNKEYNELVKNVKKEYPKIYTLSLEPDVKKYVRNYKDVENYGVYTKWGTLTKVEPYKHETYELVSKIRKSFNCNEKQAFYILYLMYEYNQSFEQIFEIIQTEPLWEIYAKEGK